VIVVDDGSTEESVTTLFDQLLRAGSWFNLRGWRVIRGENRYLGGARNVGWRAAKGQWVLFMDDDNYAKPYEVSVMVWAALHSGADIVTSANDYLPSATEPPTNETLPHGRYVPLGASLTTGMFENGFGDANALINKKVLEDPAINGWAEDDGYGVQ
ncbi:hypothetical protein CYMTET_9435, partial [Cymbomonas tetramitiformis]